MNAAHSQRVEQGEGVLGLLRHRHRTGHTVTVTVSTTVVRNQAKAGQRLLREQGQHAVGDETRMQEQHRLAITLLAVRDPGAVHRHELHRTHLRSVRGATPLPIGSVHPSDFRTSCTRAVPRVGAPEQAASMPTARPDGCSAPCTRGRGFDPLPGAPTAGSARRREHRVRERIAAVAEGAEVREGDEAGRRGNSRHRRRHPANHRRNPSCAGRPDVPVRLT
jgi:hypothetical protein